MKNSEGDKNQKESELRYRQTILDFTKSVKI